jgi:integrase
VLHLRKSDLVDGRIRITRRKKKTLRSEWIDVTPALWDILCEWGQMFEGEEFLFPGRAAPCRVSHADGRVEQVCGGGHRSRRNVQQHWTLAVKSAGLSMAGRGIHSLRHFGVTEFYSTTRDLRAAQMFAGHSSSQVTERYAHVVDMREKVHSMAALV